MKVIYKVQINWRNWKNPCRILSFERETNVKPGDDLILVTPTKSMVPRSILYNLLLDEYLVTLDTIAEIDEDRALLLVKEFRDCGWQEQAAWINNDWVHFANNWYMWESQHVQETVRQDAEASGEKVHRSSEMVAEAGVRTETQAGRSS